MGILKTNPDVMLLRYDYRAGFWGVMGRPCLGMIPVSAAVVDFMHFINLYSKL
jgi:hypothetical protein